MFRRFSAVLLAVVCLAALVPAGATAQPYPVIEEPVLRPDSLWEATDWGYKLKSLTFPSPDGPESARPTIFTQEGYSGASRPMPNMYLRMDDGELMAVRVTCCTGNDNAYVSVQASTRGTECSGGSFNLYDRRHAFDAHNIIEWVADQEWSNGNVGMFGSSFPGQTAYWTATTKPPALKAVSANLLHSDIYRDIFMPGGVQNYLFPTLWTYAAGPHRAPQDSIQDEGFQDDEICQQLQASRYSVGDLPQPQNEPAWAAARSVDDQWYSAHAALTYVDNIKIPYYQQTNWQDEQVGPRSVVLFNHINPDPVEIRDSKGKKVTIVPKVFVNSNGDHGHGGYAGRDRWAFFDIFLRGMDDTTGLMENQIVNYFEANGDGTATAKVSGNSWPFENTTYERSYLREGGLLSDEAPTTDEAPDTYLSGASRQNWFQYAEDVGLEVATARGGYPDQLEYISEPFTETQAIAGPILMNLSASIAGTDADFYVSVSDLHPDGKVSFLQRGLLKASHRAVDKRRSYYDEEGMLVQPYRPHTNPQPVTPNQIIDYKLEIFPLGYIWRPGHRILIQIHTPPILEKIWGYTPSHHQPAAVSVHHDATNQSWIQWPVVETDEPIPAESVTPCPLQGGFFCADPSPLNDAGPVRFE